MVRAIVGVTPPEQLRRRSRLFQALSAVFPADFRPSEPGPSEALDALVIIGGELIGTGTGSPTLRFEDSDAGLHPSSVTGYVQLERSQRLDTRLRGRRLAERIPAGIHRIEGGLPLAHDALGVLWALSGDGHDVEAAVLAPPELEPGQPLRDVFRAGRFMSLLPLISLLRRVTRYEEWEHPAPRAVVLFDDPNLHWPSYGYVHFARLAQHAKTHGYHVAMATVPLDSWFAHRGAVGTFRNEGEYLSLALHGNNHTFCELDVALPLEGGVSTLQQALQRIMRLERRTGLTVDRVMVPPHGLCSDEMLDAIATSGIEALCRAPVWWRGWTPAAQHTARWTMADIAPSGVPILGRHPLSELHVRDDVTLDLYLDQPAILYGHHHDLQDGYGILADAAAWLNGFRDLEWASLESLARTNVMSLREGDRLRVRAFTRRATIGVPRGVTGVDIELSAFDHLADDVLECNGRVQDYERSHGVVRAAIDVSGPELELRVFRAQVASVRSRRTRLYPVGRRAASELRDRLQPAVRGIRTSALARIEAAVGKRR